MPFRGDKWNGIVNIRNLSKSKPINTYYSGNVVIEIKKGCPYGHPL
jgi:hypothetical protein